MATDVVMPQMGESIAEGTIVRWIKKVGDKVDRDEPLFEISTDKVDAEIPSPAGGVVAEIRVKEGETVPVNSIVAVIGPAGAAAGGEPAAAAKPASAPAPAASAPAPPKPSPHGDGSPASARQAPDMATAAASSGGGARDVGGSAVAPAPSAAAARREGAPAQQREPQHGAKATEDLIRQRSSPLVRKIAKEHSVDLARIRGTGIAGRVTKDDILEYLSGQEGGKAGAQEPRTERPAGQAGRSASLSGERPHDARAPVPPAPKFTPGAGDVVEKMSPMRKRIAEHMVASRRTSAHVHSVFEVNFSRLDQIRQAKKGEIERAGAKLTYM